MKKIALLWMFLVLSITLQAQTSWDFTVTPESDVAHLKADTQNWSYDATKDRYESKVAIEGAIKADGVELDLTKGLTVSGAAAKKIRIDVNKRLQLAGKNVSVVIPNSVTNIEPSPFDGCRDVISIVVEEGNPVYYMARNKLEEFGIDTWGKFARQMNFADYDKFDYIIAMERANVRDILQILGSDPGHKVNRLLDYTNVPRDIDDPWYTKDFDKAYREIYEGCVALLKYIVDRK